MALTLKENVSKNLHTGLIVKNYKELCKLLGEEEKTNSSKIAQLKEWSRYFDFEKNGVKYIIGEIYEIPYPSVDERKKREGIYTKYIEVLLMNYLVEQENYTASFTRKNLYEMLGLVNHQFYKYSNTYEQITENINSSSEITPNKNDVIVFYERAEKKLNDILRWALQSMKQRFLIEYTEEYVICTTKVNISGAEVKEHHIANDEEIKLILQAQRDTMRNLGCEKFYELILQNKIKTFYKNLSKYINEQYGWDYTFSQMKIVCLQDEIKKQLPLRAEEIRILTRETQRTQLNNEVVKTLNKQAQKTYEKSTQAEPVKDGGFGIRRGNMQYQIDFVKIQEQLTEYLIRIDNSEKAYIEETLERKI